MSSAELSIVMPIYNEADNIETVIAEWMQELEKLNIPFEILAIDDGSTDRTAKILRALAQRYPASVFPIERPNGGHGQACRTGYSLAVARGSTWAFQIDSDGQCDPRFFADFWKAREGADCIFGVRKTRDDGFGRVVVSVACRFLTLLASGKDLGDLNVPYRLVRTNALKAALLKIPDDFDMQNVALTLALKRNPELRWKYIPIHFRDRQGGTQSINFKRIAGMGWGLIGNLHKIER